MTRSVSAHVSWFPSNNALYSTGVAISGMKVDRKPAVYMLLLFDHRHKLTNNVSVTLSTTGNTKSLRTIFVLHRVREGKIFSRVSDTVHSEEGECRFHNALRHAVHDYYGLLKLHENNGNSGS